MPGLGTLHLCTGYRLPPQQKEGTHIYSYLAPSWYRLPRKSVPDKYVMGREECKDRQTKTNQLLPEHGSPPLPTGMLWEQ